MAPKTLNSFSWFDTVSTFPVFWQCVDFLFPPHCVSCNTLGNRLCGSCRSSISWINASYCKNCGQPVDQGRNHDCIDTSILSWIRSAAVFSGPMRKSLHAIKYAADRSLANILIRLAYAHWSVSSWKFDFLVPVPLGKSRERSRGYNQAIILGQSLSRLTNIPLYTSCLQRIRDTRSQVGLTAQERKRNMEDAFVSISLSGKHILLLDDVCTTGATLQSCAKALTFSGAASVSGITLARSVVHSRIP
jgi:ComF family protein